MAEKVLGERCEAQIYWHQLAARLCGPQPGMDQNDFFKVGNVCSLGIEYIPGLLTESIWVHELYGMTAASIEQALLVKSQRKTPRYKNFHLIGTSGTGKTIFGILWLCYQAKQQAKVVYRTKASQFIYFDFSSEIPIVLQATSLDAYGDLVDSATWVIIDGKSDYVTHPGPILQCVSDTKEFHHEFAKQGMYLYMHGWTLPDCVQCAKDLGLDIADVPLRYYFCGGVPRYIFNNEPELLQDLIDGAFARINNVDEFSRILKNPNAANTFSDKIFHYKYPHRYLVPTLLSTPAHRVLVPASDYVMKKTDELFKLDAEDQRDKWLRETRELPEVVGWRFEQCAHLRLSRGGTFKMKSLTELTEVDVEIKPVKTVTVYEWELFDDFGMDLQGIRDRTSSSWTSLDEGTYVRSVIKNQAAWDSFVTGFFRLPKLARGACTRGFPVMLIRIFQMCVTQDQAVKWDPIKKLMARLREWCDETEGSEMILHFELVFVVPEEIYGSFREQQFLMKEGNHRYKRAPSDVKTLKQFALRIDI